MTQRQRPTRRGMGLINSLKTCCPKGHSYDAVENGHRRCLTCRREQNARYRATVRTALALYRALPPDLVVTGAPAED